MDVTFSVSSSLPAPAADIRRKVFMEEQGFKEEFDATDDAATHIVAYSDGVAAGTCRVFGEGGDLHIGRIAVLPAFRGTGLGSKILREAERVAKARGARTVTLLAQTAARAFYEKNGYVAASERTLYDEGVPHVVMERSLVREE